LLGSLAAVAQEPPPAGTRPPAKKAAKPGPSGPQPTILQAQAQVPVDRRLQDTEAVNPQIQLTPPGPERLFRIENEDSWKERMRQEAMERMPSERIAFPDEPILTARPYQPRAFPPLSEIVEPGYVVYRRLYFEQKNFERGGWDLGFITPFVCAGAFFWDIATLPYHVGTQPLRKWDTGAGNCLPGSPAPLLLYPPEFSVTGLLLEATVVTSLYGLFPGP
jgi:hypothetical protein